MNVISDNLCICYLLEKEHLFTGVSRMPPLTFYTAALVSIIFRDITKKGTLLLVSRMFHEKVFLCITFVITALI